MKLFIGIALSDEARAALTVASAQMRRLADGRYVEREMYHITLAFLGELDGERLDEIKGVMDEAARRAKPIPLALSGADFFGRGENAILYAGVRGAEGLHAVADDLRRALGARGLPFDPKPFRAHITLARRVNATGELLGVHVEPVAFAAGALTLFHSCRVNNAPKYLPIYGSAFQKGGL